MTEQYITTYNLNKTESGKQTRFVLDPAVADNLTNTTGATQIQTFMQAFIPVITIGSMEVGDFLYSSGNTSVSGKYVFSTGLNGFQNGVQNFVFAQGPTNTTNGTATANVRSKINFASAFEPTGTISCAFTNVGIASQHNFVFKNKNLSFGKPVTTTGSCTFYYQGMLSTPSLNTYSEFNFTSTPAVARSGSLTIDLGEASDFSINFYWRTVAGTVSTVTLSVSKNGTDFVTLENSVRADAGIRVSPPVRGYRYARVTMTVASGNSATNRVKFICYDMSEMPISVSKYI